MCRSGSIGQRSPVSSTLHVEVRCGLGDSFTKNFRSRKSRACCQHVAPERRESFINPEKRAVHGLLEVCTHQSLGPPILPNPSMHIFVTQKLGKRDSQ